MARDTDRAPDGLSRKKRKRERTGDGHHPEHKKMRSNAAVDLSNSTEQSLAVTSANNGGQGSSIIAAEGSLPSTSALVFSARGLLLNGSTSIEDADRPSVWRVSEAMGGRMLDIDPIFSPDEKFLILSYESSIQVYSTNDSLLVRRIALPISNSNENSSSRTSHIVAACLSKVSSDFLWVAASDGRVWRINWTSGAGADAFFRTKSCRVVDMTIESIHIGESRQDVLVTSEKVEKSIRHIMAYDLESFGNSSGTSLYSGREGALLVTYASEGRILACTTKKGILLGIRLSSDEAITSLSDLKYRFFSFDTGDAPCCLDFRLSELGKKAKRRKRLPCLDVVVGDCRGKILLYQDMLSALPTDEGERKAGDKHALQPRVLHWHRRAVHSVKWSQDGNYLISGGSEQVLVFWQLDTGRHDTLPHLSASIENILVSPRGSSYAVHLDDNSAMVLSTADLKPITYVSGIQSPVLGVKQSKDTLVRRVAQAAEPMLSPLVAGMSPVHASHLLLCCGNGQQVTGASGAPSTPWLQTFDLNTFQSVSKQAIARSSVAESNTTAVGKPIGEPRVTHLAFSGDGRWLATVDEWQPPEDDFEAIAYRVGDSNDFARERREIFLKFWQVDKETGNLAVVSRINQPHLAEKSETVLDLAANPARAQFATIGADGLVRLWQPAQKREINTSARGHESRSPVIWRNDRVIHVGHRPAPEELSSMAVTRASSATSGAITFSEDGSTLFAALGGSQERSVLVIDTASGEVRTVLQDIFAGHIQSMKILGCTLILLSENLRLYDTVSDQQLYGVQLRRPPEQLARLTQIAVDGRSGTFAIAAACPAEEGKGISGAESGEVAVFSLSKPEPLLVQQFPKAITTLLAANQTPGYVAIDSAAQTWSVHRATDTTSIAQPLARLNLDEAGRGTDAADELMADNEVEEEEQEEVADDEEMADSEAEDGDKHVHAAVIAPQRLTEIFDAGPASALPSVEDMFYQVTSLLSA